MPKGPLAISHAKPVTTVPLGQVGFDVLLSCLELCSERVAHITFPVDLLIENMLIVAEETGNVLLRFNYFLAPAGRSGRLEARKYASN